MSEHGFIGRTIVGVEDDDWPWLLRLDDGTAVEFDITDYGDTVTLTHLTDEVLRRRAAEEAERLVQVEKDRVEREKREKETHAHIARMREQLDPEAFEKWRRATYPTTVETLRDVWTSSSILEQFGAKAEIP
jgi:hypothetical protein